MPTPARAPSEAELLAVWENGRARHPIDRALLLCGLARPDLPVAQLGALPLGAVNAALLRLREACFGPRMDVYVDCEHCAERLEFPLDVGHLVGSAGDGDARAEFSHRGFRFRVPDARDLAAVADGHDPEAAALALLERCCVERPNEPLPVSDLLAEVEAGLEALDPAADINLDLACAVCGHRWSISLDAGVLLWDEIEAHARQLFAQVHHLARAYGWTEAEILALSPRRRATYLDMVSA